METYNKCKVIMLPTKGTTEIFLRKSNTKFGDSILFHGEFHHLYILSEEEIEEEDWCLGKDSDGKNYLIQMNNTTSPKFHYEIHKIIASTDLNLRIPQIHQSFISLYIEEYNKGNIIEEVEVEYEPCGVDSAYRQYYSLKINPDNTISIKPLKDSWNKGEVIDKLLQFRKDILNGNLSLNLKDKDNLSTFNDWIKKNV